MPTKHVVKTYDAPAFYHVYNRASGERMLFRDDQDRHYFMILLKRHLAGYDMGEDVADVKKYEAEVVAYCLMGSHFHLLMYQAHDTEAISGYMRSVGTAYSMYYNSRYKSKGHVFQSSYRAAHVDDESYLQHISRYIHLNPRYYQTCRWSSYSSFIGKDAEDWLSVDLVVSPGEAKAYERFVADYAKTNRKVQRSDLGSMLANA